MTSTAHRMRRCRSFRGGIFPCSFFKVISRRSCTTTSP